MGGAARVCAGRGAAAVMAGLGVAEVVCRRQVRLCTDTAIPLYNIKPSPLSDESFHRHRRRSRVRASFAAFSESRPIKEPPRSRKTVFNHHLATSDMPGASFASCASLHHLRSLPRASASWPRCFDLCRGGLRSMAWTPPLPIDRVEVHHFPVVGPCALQVPTISMYSGSAISRGPSPNLRGGKGGPHLPLYPSTALC